MDENIGKVMTWDDIVSNYPNCMVGLLDYNQKQKPITAKLMCVCRNEEEELKYVRKFREKGIKLCWISTFESMEYNGLWQL